MNIPQTLEDRRHHHTLRALTPPHNPTHLDFSSNDYLNLSTNQTLISTVLTSKPTDQFGATGSRLLSGNHKHFTQLENHIAKLTQKEAALCFNSGYQANLGIISTFFKKEDIIFADKYCHASLIDGIKQSGAKCVRFKHQDTQHLKQLLQKHRHHYKKALILTESIFSMQGTLTDLKQLVTLKTTFNTQLFIDEAHAFGLYGNGEIGRAHV